MRTVSLTAAAIGLATAVVSTVFVSCGTDETKIADETGGLPDATTNADGQRTGDENNDLIFGDAAPDNDGAGCALNGSVCTSGAPCCSGNCDPQTGRCVGPIAGCTPGGERCAAPNECCTFVCASGTCGVTQCNSDQQPCTRGSECCSGQCSGDGGTSVCQPLNLSCETSGNACTTNGECCSKLCASGHCSNRPSFCTQNGDACSTDFECCGGICTKATGATLGTCSVPAAPGGTQCQTAGEVCGAGADGGALPDGAPPSCGGSCCSRACAPFGATGVFVCQPPSGCRPTGEICRTDSDCCRTLPDGGVNTDYQCSKAPGAPVGRCDNGTSCRPNGAICKLATSSCNAENNCCAGNVNQNPLVCQQDVLGIPRCTPAADCADAGSTAGRACASSADCCGLPCVPNPTAGDAPFVCGDMCVSGGGACTTNADCCPGLPCVTPPGSTSGICGGTIDSDGGVSGGRPGDGGTLDAGCALYGQSCTAAGDCCGAVPCTGQRCVYPSVIR